MNRAPKQNLATTAALLTVLVSVGLGGCARYHDYDAFLRSPKPLVSATEYRMAPPDAIMIVSRRVKEIHNHREQIRPDGRITLPLLGSVFIAGMTVEEAGTKVQQMAAHYYEDADVSLRVIDYASKRIFVFGEVARPGPYPYHGANTVLGTLAMAQPTRLAEPSRIHILRPNEDGKLIKRMTVDMDAMVKSGDVRLDALLSDGDIVYVPANGLAAVGLAVQQLLLPLQPIASTVQAPVDIYRSGKSTPYSSETDGSTTY